MSTKSRHDLDTVDADIESTLHRSIHLRRRNNFLASSFLRLPTELILKIFVHAIDLGRPLSHNDSPLVLTAICHQLREVGITFPQLWSTVDFITPLTTELYLERCKYDPHILLAMESRFTLYCPAEDQKWEAVWEKLEGRTFNNLHSLVFEGASHAFADRMVGVLRRAPNISNIDLSYFYRVHLHGELSWSLSDPVPHLSTLRLRNFYISWTSPLLRNLNHLTLDPGIFFISSPIETFLTALANCPDLETLDLSYAGPDQLDSHQDNCDTIVQLRRLRGLSLRFRNPSEIRYILSHIGYSASTAVRLKASVGAGADLSEAISQLLPPCKVEALQRSQRSKALTVRLDDVYTFFTNTLSVCFCPYGYVGSRHSPQVLSRFASKIVEVVGRDTVTSLDMQAWQTIFPDGMWKVLSHQLPRLERIRYDLDEVEGGADSPDPFVLVFSQPFEGGPICPQLQHMELPWRVFTQDSSAAVLKRALTERGACGRRLKRIGLSDDAGERDKTVALEPFRDLVDEVG